MWFWSRLLTKNTGLLDFRLFQLHGMIQRSDVMAWTIGKKFGIIIALITIFVLISTVGSWISGSVIVGLAEKSRIESASFAIKAKDMQVAVIQVQQWLTDISATRGLEGFDDGFAEAKIQADRSSTNPKEIFPSARTIMSSFSPVVPFQRVTVKVSPGPILYSGSPASLVTKTLFSFILP